MSRGLPAKLKEGAKALCAAAVARGVVPPAWLGYRWVRHEPLADYLERATADARVRSELVHAPAAAQNPLPRNWPDREALPRDRGWWGYAFWDVPERASGPTRLVTIPDATVVPYVDPVKEQFWVGVLNADDRALGLREFHFRIGHAAVMRAGRAPARRARATWVAERVYHNYSHWLTAHLPKLLLLRERGALGDVLLPPDRPRFVDDSLRLFGLDPDGFETFDPTRPLEVEALTLLQTDRFRPELLRMPRAALPGPAPEPHRRIYISRSLAERRRLVNEDDVWPMLEAAGFERVHTERLPFEEQVALMREAAVLCAPHGAGLTNIMFCPPGTHVVEIADLSFPNPNFYAVAAAMGLNYWLVEAEGLGDVHPLEKDLRVAPERLARVIEQLP